jgi:ABC-type spermidine/putrescine transport system permease subunit II
MAADSRPKNLVAYREGRRPHVVAISSMATAASILIAGLFHGAALFLLTSGLQLSFGVQRIVNPHAVRCMPQVRIWAYP